MSIESLTSYLPWVAIVISIASLVIAIRSHRRAGRYHAFEYSARLELEDEIIELPHKSEGQDQVLSMGSGIEDEDHTTLVKEPNSFSYRANLVNKGQRPVTINSIFLDYGSADDNGRVRLSLEPKFYLQPDIQHHIERILTRSNIEDAMRKFEIEECHFFLRVSYSTADKKLISSTRPLGGFSHGAVHMIANPGGALT